MAYSPQVWTNSPSTASPLSAARLNIAEGGIGQASDRLDDIEADYTTTDEATTIATSRAVALAMVLGG